MKLRTLVASTVIAIAAGLMLPTGASAHGIAVVRRSPAPVVVVRPAVRHRSS